MPVYEYYCKACNHEFEREQRITDAPVKTCPSCRARQAKRMISRTSFVLKGGGWYSDLYGSSSGKDKSESSAKPAEGAAASPSGKEKPSGDKPGDKGSTKDKPAKGATAKPDSSGGGSSSSGGKTKATRAA